MNDIFSVKNFNIIEDDDSYYFFRALEVPDFEDEERGMIKKSTIGYSRLRTYRERYNETHSNPSRYKESDSISLDEVYSHVKKNFYPGTNCISFSTNCNVSLDYGYGSNKYVMIKVPKSGSSSIYSGGQYMLNELNDYLENIISTIVNDNDIVSVIRNLEQANTSEKVMEIVNEQINNYSYIENGENLISRFLPKQFFNSRQQLAYNKIIGKLTLLEISGNIKNVLPRTQSNKSLISTISMAYSSGEIINYGNKFPSDIQSVSKTTVELFALLQQAEDMGIDKEKVKLLKRRVLECAKDGFDLREYNGILGYGNEERYIAFEPSYNSILINEDNLPLDKEILVDETFRLTEGRISFKKTKDAVDFALNLGLAKEKTYELCELLKTITPDLNFDDVINNISENCYCINGRIINRRNMSGLKICESVNIDMNPTRVKVYSNDEQEKMINYISRLSRDNLRELIWSSGLSIERKICDLILSSENQKSINRYYAETIVAQVDFISIYGDERVITDEDIELLITKIEKIDCVKLYNILKSFQFSNETISNCIINLLIENGFKNYNLEQLVNLENLDELLKSNITNLNNKVSAIRLDKLLGISDNDNHIENTEINLRDYQQDAVNIIDSLFEHKKFAGVILPTGAGKSFVAMAEMLKHRNQNILYYAPNVEILNQITKHIMKNILNMSNDEIQKLYDEHQTIPNGKFLPTNIEEIIKIAFPHLKLYCYQGLTNKDDEFFNSHDADLIIFDEIHRAGATEWNKKIKKLINGNPNAHLLGITATPIRDVDRQDMMLKFAELSGDYTKTELMQKKYLASELYLIDAMQEGIVVVPNLVSFDYSLEGSEQYKEIKKMYEEETDPIEKSRLKSIYDEMRQIVENSKKQGMPSIIKEAFEKNHKKSNGRYIVFLPLNTNHDLTTEQYIQSEIEKVKHYFSLIDDNPEIGYLLSNRQNTNENSIAMSNFEKDSEHLKLIFAINMLNEGVHVDGIDGIVMLRPIGANTRILYSQQTGRCVFALDPNNPILDSEVPLIFDVYNNYLEQNMDREVNKSNSTSDLQKMRHAVYWIKRHRDYFPDINSEDINEYRKAAILKKIQLKYSKYLIEDFGDNLTPTEQYEIEEILTLGKSVNLWDRIILDRVLELPISSSDVERINTFKATGETKKFLELYKDARQKSKSSVKVGTLRLKTAIATLELLSEYGISINNDLIQNDTVLQDILKLIPSELLTLVKNEMDDLQISSDYPIGTEYTYVKQMFCTRNPVFLEYSIRTLRISGIFHSFINDKGKEIQAIDSRGFIVKGRPEYRNINIYTGSYYDIDGLDIEGYDELYFKAGDGPYNKYGFDREGIHFKTKTKLNPYGFDIYGNYNSQNEDGTYENKGKYNDYGFDINGLWYKKVLIKKTGKIQMTYTGSTFDAEGFDIDGFNKYKFGRDGFYYTLDSDGKYVSTGKKQNIYGFNIDGIHENGTKYDKYGFDISGKHLNGTDRDNYGFDRDGFSKLYVDGKKSKYINGFDRDGINETTGLLYNKQGFDRDGFYWKLIDEEHRQKTEEKYNERGFDIFGLHKITRKRFDIDGCNSSGRPVSGLPDGFFDSEGFYWKLIDDVFKKTDSIYNDDGFDVNGNNKNGTLYDAHGFDVNGRYRNGRFYDDYGFKANGSYKIMNYFIDDRTKTYSLKDGYGFDRDGNYWEIIDYKRVKINSPIDKYQFDRDGNYWEQQSDGTFLKTDSLYNPRGFDCRGIHKDTHLSFDEYGLTIKGTMSGYFYNSDTYYDVGTGNIWKKQADGKIENLGKYDKFGFNHKGIHKDTGLPFDTTGRDREGSTIILDRSNGFDANGDYWERQYDGTYRCTHNKFNKNQFDQQGYYWEKQGDNTYVRTNKKTNKAGFDANGLIFLEYESRGKTKKYKSKYDKRGFDINGNREDGSKYNYEGFDVNSVHRNGTPYNDNGFNEEKIHKNGTLYDDNGFDYDGIHKDTHKKYDRNGYDRFHKYIGFEYDKYGFDVNGNNKNGTLYDDNGFDANGNNKNGTLYDDNGFDRDGINCDTKTSISQDRYDQDGLFHKSDKEDEICYYYNIDGFDREGYYWEKQEDGSYVKTDKKYNPLGFDKDGYYWEQQSDGTFIKTNRVLTNDGFDKNGFNRDGIHYETKLDYDKHYFRKDGINIYTNDKYDINGFDINGIHKNTNTYCNFSGFDRDGIHCITHTRYDEHGLDTYRNAPFDLQHSASLPYEVYITKKYLDSKFLLIGVSKEFYQIFARKYGYTKISDCDKKISEIMIKGFYMCPELKKSLVSQLSMLNFTISRKRNELSKLDASIEANKSKIDKLKKEINYYERKESTFSTYG